MVCRSTTEELTAILDAAANSRLSSNGLSKHNSATLADPEVASENTGRIYEDY